MRPQPDQFVTGLERDAYLTPIALVAMAHGTSYFEGAVAELRALSDSPGNEPLRGPLLAALLLIGDELDLHEDRASFPPEMRRSPEADLHHYVHHYISRVQVVEGATPQVRRICLTFKFPAGADYAAEVEEWVAGKLHKQCNLTSDIIWTSTKGELQWDDKIFVKTTSDAHGVKGELPDESRSVLRGILARTRVVDRDGFIDEVDSFLRCPEPRRIDIVEEPNSDLECLLDWVLARSSVAGVPAILISLEERIGHSPADILDTIAEEFARLGRPLEGYIRQRESEPNVSTEAIVADIAEGGAAVIVFQAVDRAEPGTRQWVDRFREKLQRVQILSVGTAGEEAEGSDAVYRLGAFREADIAGKLAEEFGLSTENAAIAAREIFEFSQGVPLNVLSGLDVRRRSRMQENG